MWFLSQAPSKHANMNPDILEFIALAPPGPLPSLEFSVPLVGNCEMLAAQTARAYLNHGIGTSITTFASQN